MQYKLIKAKLILTLCDSLKSYSPGIILIKDDIIEYIGNYEESIVQNIDYELIDLKDCIITPGFVNAHTHSAMYLLRSLSDDVKDRLKKVMFPIENNILDADFVRVSSLCSMAEFINGGITCFADMYYFSQSTAQSAKKSGLRAFIGQSVTTDAKADASCIEQGFERTKELIDSFSKDELITPSIAPHSPYGLTENDALKTSKFACENNLLILSHLAEMPFEEKYCLENFGLRPIPYFEKVGLLDNSTMAHCIFSENASDREILKNHNVGISNNVAANAKSGKGISPVIDFLNEGLNVGIGTDGPMSGNTQDTLSLLRWVGNMQKVRYQSPVIINSKILLQMATIGGAKALHVDNEIGSLEVGKKADIIAFSTNSINMNPIYDPYSTIVYNATPSDISFVMVNGKVLKKDHKLLSIDFNEAYSNCKIFEDRIRKDYGPFY